LIKYQREYRQARRPDEPKKKLTEDLGEYHKAYRAKYREHVLEMQRAWKRRQKEK
jgi:hypothetical protein